MRGHILVHPTQDGLQHLAIILLHHHHVAIAVDAVLCQAQLFRRASGLLQERHGTRRARCCERRFGSHHDDRNALQIFQTARGLFLDGVRTHARLRRRHFLGLQFGWIFHWWIVGHRDRCHAPSIRKLAFSEGIARAFDHHDAFHQSGPHFRHQKAERPAGRMRHDDGGSDFVEQFRAALAPSGMRDFNIRDIRSALRCNQLRQVRRTYFARARPLSMQLREPQAIGIGLLGALRREHVRDLIQREVLRRKRAVQIGMIRRTAVAGPIDHVDFVAFLHQQRGPARTAVGAAHPVRALAAPAMNQHDGKRMLDHSWNLVLHIHLLAVDDGPARDFSALHAHPEEAPFSEIERRIGGSRGVRLGGRLAWAPIAPKTDSAPDAIVAKSRRESSFSDMLDLLVILLTCRQCSKMSI